MALHNELGNNGELIAYRYITQKLRLRILEKNWRHNQWEIDLIATDEHFLIIIEVKTRVMNTIKDPASAVNKRKQINLCHATDFYVRSHGIDMPVRFDVLSIYYQPSNETFEVDYLPNAFQTVPIWKQKKKKWQY